jgi:hypothetical protein
MHESVLKDYFCGNATVAALQDDLVGSVVVEKSEKRISSQRIVDMSTDFELQPQHLVISCDSVLAGELEPVALETIGFCLIASDHFVWDGDIPPGDIVAETLHDWSAPEINYPLTLDTVQKFKERLLTGKDLLAGGQAT